LVINIGKINFEDYDQKALILLEHEEQVKDCAVWLHELKGRKQIIALSPFAIYEMDRRKIPYHIPEDYYSLDELYRMGIDNFLKVESICSIIDKHIHKACPHIARLSIKPALFSFFNLKILYDAATIRLFQLFKIINAEIPDVIFIYGNSGYPSGFSDSARSLFWDNRESIYAQLLALAGWKIPVVMLTPVRQPESAYLQRNDSKDILGTVKLKVMTWLGFHPQLYRIAVLIRNRKWRNLLGEFTGYTLANKRVAVLLAGAGLNWDDSREALQVAGISPVFKMAYDWTRRLIKPESGRINSKNLFDAWQGLQIDSDFRKFFKWDNVDFFPVLEERHRFLVESLTPACLMAYEEALEVIKNKRIAAVLSSGFSTCTLHSIAQAACNAGIPVVTWQHGGNGHFDYLMRAYIDLVNSNIHFTFGEGIVEEFAASAKKLNTQIIPVGSASLDKQSKEIAPKYGASLGFAPDKKTILYVTTNFYQNNLYISFPLPHSDNLLWQTQRTITDVLKKHNQYKVIIKTRPSHGYRETPLRSYAENLGFKNCQYIRNERLFTGLLLMADIIVIDTPATTLLQALVTAKPVFAYFGHLRIDSKARALLERRAYCFDELSDFVANLDAFLSNGVINIKVDLNDRAFLEKYGLHKSDGKSGERAARALKAELTGYQTRI